MLAVPVPVSTWSLEKRVERPETGCPLTLTYPAAVSVAGVCASNDPAARTRNPRCTRTALIEHYLRRTIGRWGELSRVYVKTTGSLFHTWVHPVHLEVTTGHV